VGPSLNGKLSEYHAAIGLAELDGWPEKRAGFMRAARHYRELAAAGGLAPPPLTGGDHASAYALYAAASTEEAGGAMAGLRAHGIEHRLWYGKGIHRQPQYRDCPRGRLAVTEDLAPRIIGLPMATDLDDKSVDRVVEALSRTRQP
jgi:dTDP-4-amino-4,6-dideoxygalactose transaminase